MYNNERKEVEPFPTRIVVSNLLSKNLKHVYPGITTFYGISLIVQFLIKISLPIVIPLPFVKTRVVINFLGFTTLH